MCAKYFHKTSGFGKCNKCQERIAWLLSNPKNVPVNPSSLSEIDKLSLNRKDPVWYREGEHVPHWRTCFANKKKEDTGLFDSDDYSQVYKGD